MDTLLVIFGMVFCCLSYYYFVVRAVAAERRISIMLYELIGIVLGISGGAMIALGLAQGLVRLLVLE